MQRLFYLIGIFTILSLTLLVSCKKSEHHLSKNNLVDTKTQIYKMGFDTAGIIDMGDYYLVEGDILIKKNFNKTVPRQASTKNIAPVYLNYQSDIKVFIDSSIPDDSSQDNWRLAISNSITNFNNLNSNIKFRLVTSLPADLIAKGSLDIPGYVAAAQFPLFGKPGDTLYINFDYSYLSDDEKTYIITHELGHIIGFRHTDWRQHGEAESGPDRGDTYGAYTIGYSPNYGQDPDVNSVFNKFIFGRSWGPNSGFSYWDLYAITYLYGNLINLTTTNTSTRPYTVTFTHTSASYFIFSSYPGNSYVTNQILEGTYDIALVPMYSGTDNTQLIFNGQTYNGPNYYFNNINISSPLSFAIQSAQSSSGGPGPCSLVGSSGFYVPTSNLNQNGATAGGYILLVNQALLTPGVVYKVATFGCCRPAAMRTVYATVSNRSWTLNFYPNGELWISFYGNNLPGNSSSTIYFNYNL